MELHPNFNLSSIAGKLLVYNGRADGRMFTCGVNRLGRTLGAAQLAGLAWADEELGGLPGLAGFAWTPIPGGWRKIRREGEFHDSALRGGDEGIRFPHVMLEAKLDPVIHAMKKGYNVTVELTSSVPNQWVTTMCGWWVPMRALLVMAHLVVIEWALW